MINCIIMASGYSRRMGREKLLLPYKNKPLVQHIIEKVSACDFSSSIIIAKDRQILNLAAKNGLKTIENNSAFLGQCQAIKLGIINSPKAQGYMFFTADQPLIDVETIKLLMNIFEKNHDSIIVPRFKERKGSPVIFPLKYVNELLKLEGDKGGRKIISKHREHVIFVDVNDENSLMDIDIWEDYEKIINTKE